MPDQFQLWKDARMAKREARQARDAADAAKKKVADARRNYDEVWVIYKESLTMFNPSDEFLTLIREWVNDAFEEVQRLSDEWVWLLFVDGYNILRNIRVSPQYSVGGRAYFDEK